MSAEGQQSYAAWTGKGHSPICMSVDGGGRRSGSSWRPGPPAGPIFQVVVTAANFVSDFRHERGLFDRSWDSAVKTATARRSDGWTVEMALPWADLELSADAGPVMGLNLTRWQPRIRANSHWGKPGHAKNNECLGRMEGVDLDFDRYDIGVESSRLIEGLYYGGNLVPVKLRNDGGRPRKLRIEGESFSADGSPMVAPPVSHELRLGSGKDSGVVLRIPVTNRHGRVAGCVRVIDAESGLAFRQITRHTELPEDLLSVRLNRRYLYRSDRQLEATLQASIGEGTLARHFVRIKIPRANEAPLVQDVVMTQRLAKFPIKVHRLPFGEAAIEFEIRSMATDSVLDSATAKVVRLVGPFDEAR